MINPTDEAMIILENVSKWYGDFNVLSHCSTRIHKGEVVVVCGPSGSGKSTLIKTVNGLEPVQSGKIFVNNTEVTSKKPTWPAFAAMSAWSFSTLNFFRI